jgi:uncharacterized protein YukE
MDDKDSLAALTESVASLQEDVKRADDTLAGVDTRLHNLCGVWTGQSHASDRIRSRMIDIDAKLDQQGHRFDRIDEALRQILDKVR